MTITGASSQPAASTHQPHTAASLASGEITPRVLVAGESPSLGTNQAASGLEQVGQNDRISSQTTGYSGNHPAAPAKGVQNEIIASSDPYYEGSMPYPPQSQYDDHPTGRERPLGFDTFNERYRQGPTGPAGYHHPGQSQEPPRHLVAWGYPGARPNPGWSEYHESRQQHNNPAQSYHPYYGHLYPPAPIPPHNPNAGAPPYITTARPSWSGVPYPMSSHHEDAAYPPSSEYFRQSDVTSSSGYNLNSPPGSFRPPHPHQGGGFAAIPPQPPRPPRASEYYSHQYDPLQHAGYTQRPPPPPPPPGATRHYPLETSPGTAREPPLPTSTTTNNEQRSTQAQPGCATATTAKQELAHRLSLPSYYRRSPRLNPYPSTSTTTTSSSSTVSSTPSSALSRFPSLSSTIPTSLLTPTMATELPSQVTGVARRRPGRPPTVVPPADIAIKVRRRRSEAPPVAAAPSSTSVGLNSSSRGLNALTDGRSSGVGGGGGSPEKVKETKSGNNNNNESQTLATAAENATGGQEQQQQQLGSEANGLKDNDADRNAANDTNSAEGNFEQGDNNDSVTGGDDYTTDRGGGGDGEGGPGGGENPLLDDSKNRRIVNREASRRFRARRKIQEEMQEKEKEQMRLHILRMEAHIDVTERERVSWREEIAALKGRVLELTGIVDEYRRRE